ASSEGGPFCRRWRRHLHGQLRGQKIRRAERHAALHRPEALSPALGSLYALR
ncbi:hypothetical protein NGA_2127300, partial [Nannochloropsis gaditana CCMP526]|uniref:uncharacterized protein n=1 Tax=Nannochloropsis gaditana (strain CCMP526) TaxID=1093141 RepID=UPI00029F804A